jgi:RimJ/RimL family protein N-acetyltransferase
VNVHLFDDWLIRDFVPDDAESIVKYANNRHVSVNLRDSFPFPYTIHDAKRWLKSVKKQNPSTSWAIASSKEVVGGIGIHLQPDIFRQSAEIGYWLGEPFWNRGIATAAVKAVVEHTFTHFELTRVFAGVFEWNPVSSRVLEKAGFRVESRMRKAVIKDGKNIDQLMYVLLKEEWQSRQIENLNR